MLFRSLPSQSEFPSGDLLRAFISPVDVESIFATICIICPAGGRPGSIFSQLSLQDPVLTFWVESKFLLYKQPELSILKDGILKNRVRSKNKTIVLTPVSPSHLDSSGSRGPRGLLSEELSAAAAAAAASPGSWDVSWHRNPWTPEDLLFCRFPGEILAGGSLTYSSFSSGLKLTIAHHMSRK